MLSLLFLVLCSFEPHFHLIFGIVFGAVLSISTLQITAVTVCTTRINIPIILLSTPIIILLFFTVLGSNSDYFAIIIK